MRREEFTKIMAYISVAINKPMSGEMAEVYFDLLGDLPVSVLQLAAKRVCLEHKWASFPTVAEIREFAALAITGQIKAMSAAEAWESAWRAVGHIDLEIEGSAERATNGLSPLVVESMRAFGIPALVYGKEPVSIIRAQFMRIFESLAARDKSRALLPPKMATKIEGKRIESRDNTVQQIVRQFGKGGGI